MSRYEDVLRFFIERKISLFTNNAAEREVRNIKVKSKIQGTFRSELRNQIYCRIRGYISTMKKNEKNQCPVLKSIFDLYEIMFPRAKQQGSLQQKC